MARRVLAVFKFPSATTRDLNEKLAELESKGWATNWSLVTAVAEPGSNYTCYIFQGDEREQPYVDSDNPGPY